MIKLTLLAALLFCSCAGTRFYDPTTGRLVAAFQGDMTDSDYTGGVKPHWKVGQVSHSTATLAGGQSTAQIVNAFAAGFTAAILAYGTGGGTGALPVVTKLGAATIPVVGHVTSSRNPVQPVTLHRQ